MSNIDWLDDDEDEDETPPAPTEGDLIKKLRKYAKAQEKELKELKDFKEAATKKETEFAIKQVLKEKGVNEKAARLILKDLVEVNIESVSKWLEENGDMFVNSNSQQSQEETDPDEDALARQNSVSGSDGTPNLGNQMSKMIDEATTFEELVALTQL